MPNHQVVVTNLNFVLKFPKMKTWRTNTTISLAKHFVSHISLYQIAVYVGKCVINRIYMSRLQPLVSCKMFLDFAPPWGSRPRPRLLTELLWSLDLPAMTPLAYCRKQASLSIQNNVADRNKQWVALVELALGCSSLTREMFSSVMTVVRIRKG